MSRDRWLDDDEERTVPRRGPASGDQDKNRFVGLLILLLGVYFVLERATGTDLRLFPFLATAFFGSLAWRGAGWAWIPTAIFGVGVFSQIGGAFAASDLMLPTVFVIGGGMLLLREHIPPVTRKIIFLVLGIMALGAIFGNDDHDPNPDLNININRARDRAVAGQNTDAIPELNGRRLVIAGSSGDVSLTARGTERSVSGGVRVTDTPVQVTVIPIGSAAISVSLPAGSKVQVVTGSGDVEAEGSWDSLAITTQSGAVDVEWEGVDDPALQIATASGDVEVDLLGNPDVRITTGSGGIEVDGYEGVDEDPDKTFRHDSDEPGDVRVTTSSGDVDLTRRDRELR